MSDHPVLFYKENCAPTFIYYCVCVTAILYLSRLMPALSRSHTDVDLQTTTSLPLKNVQDSDEK